MSSLSLSSGNFTNLALRWATFDYTSSTDFYYNVAVYVLFASLHSQINRFSITSDKLPPPSTVGQLITALRPLLIVLGNFLRQLEFGLASSFLYAWKGRQAEIYSVLKARRRAGGQYRQLKGPSGQIRSAWKWYLWCLTYSLPHGTPLDYLWHLTYMSTPWYPTLLICAWSLSNIKIHLVQT